MTHAERHPESTVSQPLVQHAEIPPATTLHPITEQTIEQIQTATHYRPLADIKDLTRTAIHLPKGFYKPSDTV